MNLDTTQLQEVLSNLLVWAQSTKDFVTAETPLLCKEIILYGQCVALTKAAITLLATTVLVFTSYTLAKKGERLRRLKLRDLARANCNEDVKKRDKFYISAAYENYLIASIAALVVAFVSTLLTISPMLDFIRATFAPRLYIVQQLSTLLRNL